MNTQTHTHTCWLAAYQRISECFMNLRHWWWKRLDVWRKTDIKCLVLLSVFTSPLKRVELRSAWMPRPNRCYKVTFGTHKMVDSGWTFSGGFNSPLFAKQASWHHVLDARTNSYHSWITSCFEDCQRTHSLWFVKVAKTNQMFKWMQKTPKYLF